MKFKDFINEAPYMLDVNKASESLDFLYKHVDSENKSKVEVLDSKYKLKTYQLKNNYITFVMNGDQAIMYIKYNDGKLHSKNDHKPYSNVIQTKYVDKIKSLPSSEVSRIYYLFMSRFDAVLSDNHHSVGGKQLWKKMLKLAYDNHNVFGYKNPHEIYYTKDKTYNEFYKEIEDEAYGSNAILFIEFTPDLERLGL